MTIARERQDSQREPAILGGAELDSERSFGVSPRLPHGYTNWTRRVSPGLVEKHYDGADCAERYRREVACLSQLGRYVPVPQIVGHDDATPSVTMAEIVGRPGQELMEEGHATLVMQLVGETLRALRGVDTDAVTGIAGDGSVLVHGDFGPQNMLIDPANGGRLVALLDWEFAHLGRPVEDLAWAEWIVRMHHPRHVESIGDLLAHCGESTSWADRHEAMVQRCRELVRRSHEADSREAEALWRTRTVATERWTDHE